MFGRSAAPAPPAPLPWGCRFRPGMAQCLAAPEPEPTGLGPAGMAAAALAAAVVVAAVARRRKTPPTSKTIADDDAVCDAAVPACPSPLRTDLRWRLREPMLLLMMLVLVFSRMITFPFSAGVRDEIGVGIAAYAAMRSAASLASLLGKIVIGRASDLLGRRIGLVLGIAGAAVDLAAFRFATTVPQYWWGVVVGASLSATEQTLRSLVGDWASYADAPASAIRAQQGRLGMAAGLGMGGAALTRFIPDRNAAATVSGCAMLVALAIALLLPTVPRTKPAAPVAEGKPVSAWAAMLSVECARTPGGLLLLGLRAIMSMAFHLYMTVWQARVKTRFNFSPGDYAKFHAFIGLSYALSQGAIAKPALKLGGDDPTYVLVACCAVLAGGRILATHTTSLPAVYGAMSVVVVALGVFNAAISAAASTVAGPQESGTFFGIISAVESTCGVVGPGVAAVAYLKGGDMGVLAGVVGLYLAAGVLLAAFWGKHVAGTAKAAEASKAANKAKVE